MRLLKITAGVIASTLISVVLAGSASAWESAEVDREEGEYKISYAGQEIGSEKFILTRSKNSAGSSSVLSIRNPSKAGQKIQIETKLEMDENFLPRSYELKSEVGGQKGSIVGKFSPNQVIFEYRGGETPRRSGLLVGNEYTLLDTNIFHHFIFIARLFKEQDRGKMQQFEVVIPQEGESGFLRVTELKKETIEIEGKEVKATHLQVDSGSLLIQLWLDGRGNLRKISVPTRQIEIIRRD